MVDIHCHILPGLDDGPRDWEPAVAMCRMAHADGITHTVATPHANYAFEFSPSRIRQQLSELQARAAVMPTMVTGCDFHLDFDNLQELYREPQKFTINQKSYLLVEFDTALVLPHFDRLFYEMQSHGVTPIVTHPERNVALQGQPALVRRMIEVGAPVQITAASLEGRFGRRAERSARQLLRQRMVHIVASDAHDTESRPPVLSRGYEIVRKAFSSELAEQLFVANPRAVLDGVALPYLPEPIEEKRRWFLP